MSTPNHKASPTVNLEHSLTCLSLSFLSRGVQRATVLAQFPAAPAAPGHVFPLWGSAYSSRTRSPDLQFPVGRLKFTHFLTYSTVRARGPDTHDKHDLFPVRRKGQQCLPGPSVLCVFSQVRYSGCHSCPLPERVVFSFPVTSQEIGQEVSGPQSSVSLRLFSFFVFLHWVAFGSPHPDLFTY